MIEYDPHADRVILHGNDFDPIDGEHMEGNPPRVKAHLIRMCRGQPRQSRTHSIPSRLCPFLLPSSPPLSHEPCRTMLRPQLPLECFLTILRYLSQEYDTDTMSRLLRVNKSVCAAALPVLYGSCFDRKLHECRPPPSKHPSLSITQLIRTLLLQVRPQVQIPDLLRIAYFSQDHELSSRGEPAIKYGLFLRNVWLDYPNPIRSPLTGIQLTPELEDYSISHNLQEAYLTEGLIQESDSWPSIRVDLQESQESMDTAAQPTQSSGTTTVQSSRPLIPQNLWYGIVSDVHRQLTWVLCQDHPEIIESLLIPLSDIERYIDNVEQFTSLSKAMFIVDKVVFIPSRSSYWMTDPELRERHRQNSELELERDRLFEAMKKFVQRHTSFHKGVLQKVSIPSLKETPRHKHQDFQLEISTLLPPLQNLRTVNNQNWNELVHRISETDLSKVESISLTRYGSPFLEEKTLALLDKSTLDLQRFRTLKVLEMESLGSDMFQWAVQEKRKWDAEHGQEESGIQSFQSWQQKGQLKELVPLRSIRISHWIHQSAVQELDDIITAFSNSLEDLTAIEILNPRNMFLYKMDDKTVVTYGEGWSLPRLRTLTLKAFYSRLRFDMDGLERSPALESLYLADKISIYSYQSIRPWTPVHLPHLQTLFLMGSPALHFDMDSLHYSPKLKTLHLSMPKLGKAFCIPHPAEMEIEGSGAKDTLDYYGPSSTLTSSEQEWKTARPLRWTWDWYLPHLQTLRVEAIFAFKFDFQWLQLLPNLRDFSLDSSSTQEAMHIRSLTTDDFLRSRHQEEDEEKGRGLYFSLPKLSSILIQGVWDISTKALEVLCLTVAPNLTDVCLGAKCSGYTLEEWVLMARRMPVLEKSYLWRLVSKDEIRDLGLRSLNELTPGSGEKRLIQHTLAGMRCWDIVDT